MAATAMRSWRCHLHDALSLGDVERALTTAATTTSATKGKDEVVQDTPAQPETGNSPGLDRRERDREPVRHRLPLLLRLLRDSGPLSSLPDVFDGDNNNDNNNKSTSSPREQDDDDADDDKGVRGAVERLEDSAAADSTAEDVEQVACAWAPQACRVLHHRSRGTTKGKGLYDMSAEDVEALFRTRPAAAAATTMGSSKKRPKVATGLAQRTEDDDDDDKGDELASDTDRSDEGGGGDVAPSAPDDDKKRRRRASSASRSGANDDSPEAAVSRTLEELVKLVHAHSSAPYRATRGSYDQDNADESRRHGDDAYGAPTDDLILAQEERSHRHAGVHYAGGGGLDVPSTVAALMHHASPLLTSPSVAEAVCRAALPQSHLMVARIGANQPACVPGLVAGALQALQQPSGASRLSPARRTATARAVHKTLVAVAQLSPRESARVRTAVAAQYEEPHRSRPVRSVLLELRLELLVAAAAEAQASADRGGDDDDDDDDDGAAALEVACLVNEQFRSWYLPNRDGRPGGDVGDDYTYSNDDHDVELAADRAGENPDNADDDDCDAVGRADDAGGDGGRSGSVPVPSRSERQATANNGWSSSSLLHLVLSGNPTLLHGLLRVLQNDLARQRREDDDRPPSAQFSFVATALAWILLTIPLTSIKVEKSSAGCGLEPLLRQLGAWVARFLSLSSPEAAAEQVTERLFRVLTCACFAALCASVQQSDQLTSGAPEGCDMCCSMLSDLFLWTQKPPARPCFGFAARVLLRAGRNDVQSLIEATLLQIEGRVDTATDPKEHVIRACQRLRAVFTSEQLEAICLGPSGTIELPIDLLYGLDLAGDVLHTETRRSEKLREMMEHLLQKKTSADFLQNSLVPSFIETATCFLSHGCGSSSLPIIHPFDMEKLSMPLKFDRNRSLTVEEKHFILCLLYSFAYRAYSRNDVFVLDFHALPVVAVRHVAKLFRQFGLSSNLGSKLGYWIDRFCPEALQKKAYSYCSRDEANRISRPQLLRTLRRSIESPEFDPSGTVAQKAYLIARRSLPESTCTTTTVSAFFSEPNNLPPFFTYASLYRDPLILLKSSINIWQRQGLRRIVLSMLDSLLITNDAVLEEFAPNEDAIRELSDARDLLLTRSLATLMTTTFDPSMKNRPVTPCDFTLFFIRRTMSRNPGLFAAMLKQGLPDVWLDWIIDWVPECVVDSAKICEVLTQRTSLGAPERLAIADGAFRVAVMYGGLGKDDLSQPLVMAALSQLVSSFFLVLGPVGVPVATILGSGHDATTVSRKAAFRILNAMGRVQSYRLEVRGECIAAVQKLVGLCKGENILAGLPGAVASRQKKLLKELLDALHRANNAMGNTQVVVQL